MYDLYESNRSDSERYILGRSGKRTLFAVGLNPSTANREKSDTTVAKVETVALNSGYDGFVMANLYPRRSTIPGNLPAHAMKASMARNIAEILKHAEIEEAPRFWAAWGVNIVIRDYLVEALQTLNAEIEKIGGLWYCYGDRTKSGHPKHPSRLSYEWVFQPFDMNTYIEKLDEALSRRV